ncbi:MAG: T9SS type A sorting domain-containing protein [Bacteroidota bacterium]|jgi:hypothetical protein
MKNILRLVRCGGLLFVVFCLLTNRNPLHAQKIQSNGPYGVNVRGIPLSSNRIGGFVKTNRTDNQYTITATAETHGTIPTPDPTPPPTQGFSGPITITQGGTYSVHVVSQNQGPAITIATPDPVTITNSVIEGTSKLITCSTFHVKLTVINSDLYGLYPGGTGNHADLAVDLYKFDYLHFMHNHIYQNGGINLVLWSGSYQGGSPIVVKYNYAYNIDGRLTDGIGGYSGSVITCFVQLNTDTNAAGVEIAWNEVENIPNQSRVEDNISIFASSGTANSPIDIHDNFIRGGYPFPADDATVYTGAGITLGDYGGNFEVARNNQVIETTGAGIDICGGTNETIHDNRIVATKCKQTYGVGILILNQYAWAPFGNNKSYNNIVGWYRSASGFRQDWNLPGDVLDSNNVHLNGDGTPITLTDVANEYAIWQNKRGGIISPSGEVTVNDNESLRFTFTLNPEFPVDSMHVDSVLVDGVMVDSTEGYTFTNVKSNHTIRVIYAIGSNVSIPQNKLSANGDTMYITGGMLAGLENAGALETAVNGDVNADGTRKNVNRVYALYEGQYYLQQGAIVVVNPTGTLTFVGVPSASGTTKPVWMMRGNIGPILINDRSCNRVYGSLKFRNIHYVARQLDGTLQNENFVCGTQNKLPQSLTIDNCLFEFSNIDIFDCTNDNGAIGGWPYGAKFRITNTYFRNLFNASQWWGSRIFQCEHPIDTLWIENVTTTGGGLTFLQQNELTDFAYFNHNTIVNNHKYWIQSPYYKTLVVTNNIFLNQNWVGEDSTVANSSQGPDKLYMSTINVDTINHNNQVVVQQKYYASADSNSYTSDLAPQKLKVFVSNNINYWNPLLLDYFTNANNITGDGTSGYVNSWLYWGWSFKLPQRINNMPCEWMNSRTQALFTKYAPPAGGFIADAPLSVSPGSPTIDNIDAATRNIMMQWNQNKYSDPNWATAPDCYHSKMIFGDFDPTTIPGINAAGAKGQENGIGITKFTDLAENWDATVMSTIDNLPLGALSWNDARIAAFDSKADYAKVNAAYLAKAGKALAVNGSSAGVVDKFELAQNYPNPFNPTTTISFSLPSKSFVSLKIFDLIGREVATIISEEMLPGNYSRQWNAASMSSGVYFYRLQAGIYIETKKLILLR